MAPGFYWIRKLADDAELTGEALPGESVIEIVGKGRVLIEGHHGVCGYSSCQICIKVPCGIAEINGCNLKLTQMDISKLIISGEISSICLFGRAGA